MNLASKHEFEMFPFVFQVPEVPEADDTGSLLMEVQDENSE